MHLIKTASTEETLVLQGRSDQELTLRKFCHSSRFILTRALAQHRRRASQWRALQPMPNWSSPFYFSPRYAGREEELRREIEAARAGFA